jgi:glycosyltransferase involved in cell wall biosynthesis
MKTRKILFLVPYPLDAAPSQRFRFEQYFGYLEEANLSYKVSGFFGPQTWSILYSSGNFPGKIFGFALGLLRRCIDLFRSLGYDYVFIHREIAPAGPPFFEFVIAKIFRKKIIFDFDDAIWLPNSSRENNFIRFFRFYGKTASVCKWAWKVSVGNEYLAQWAKQHNKNVLVVPTTVRYEKVNGVKKIEKNRVPVLGWTGSHSTLGYLFGLSTVLNEVYKVSPFRFRLISDRPPSFEIPGLEFVKWSAETEVTDLLPLDIGLMPLEDNPWTRGKCGLKIIQYLSLSIPALASPVGVNKDLIDHGKNGFLCSTEMEWKDCLIQLLTNEPLRNEMAEKAPSGIFESYTNLANKAKFLHLFSKPEL